MSTDTNVFVCVGRDYNKALLSGLIVEERTQQLLEVAVGKCDYRVALFEVNLRSSRLWAFVEESRGIPVLPVDFVLPLLRLRHAIHVVFGGSDLQPLTMEELWLVEDMVKGKLGILSAKEAKALLEGAASSSQKKGKRERPLVDTRVVDDPKGYKQSKMEAASVAAAGACVTVSPNSSLAKSAKRVKSKSSEGERTLTVSLPADGSAYFDPSFIKELSDSLLLPVDRKRLVDIGPVQSVEWSMAHLYQVFCRVECNVHLLNVV